MESNSLEFLERYLFCLNELYYQGKNIKTIERLGDLIDGYEDILRYMPALRKQLTNNQFILQTDENGQLLLDVDNLSKSLEKIREILNILDSRKVTDAFKSNILQEYTLSTLSNNLDETFDQVNNLPLYWPEWCFIDINGDFVMPWENHTNGYYFHSVSQKCFLLSEMTMGYEDIEQYIKKLVKTYGIYWSIASKEDIQILQEGEYIPELLNSDKFVWLNKSLNSQFYYAQNLKNYSRMQAHGGIKNYTLVTGLLQ